MQKTAVIITNTEVLSEAIAGYLNILLKMETYAFTYENSDLLSGEIFNNADIFIFGLLRVYDNFRIRAEGIPSAQWAIKGGKRALIVAPEVNCDKIRSPIYWDVACDDEIKDRIKGVLELDEHFDFDREIEKLKDFYKDYLTPPSHHH